MAMTLVNRRDIILSVRKRWEEQYPEDNYVLADGTRTKDIRKKLLSLDLEKCSGSDVDKVIGTTGWASNECDECNRDCQTTIHIGDDPDYEARWQVLCLDCLDCLLKAARIISKAA